MTAMIMTSLTDLILCPPVCRVRDKLETVAIASVIAAVHYATYNIWTIALGYLGGAMATDMHGDGDKQLVEKPWPKLPILGGILLSRT